MQRITITIDDELAHEIDKLAQSRGYQNRSETVRDLVRAGIVQTQHDGHRAAECVASVVYVYDQGTRESPEATGPCLPSATRSLGSNGARCPRS
jgi:CopG family nickel-responsive transcriptional regulator